MTIFQHAPITWTPDTVINADALNTEIKEKLDDIDANVKAMVGASAYLSADQNNIASAGVGYYKINLNMENYDIGDDFDIANYRYVVPVTGYYQVNGVVSFESTELSSGHLFGAAIFVDPLGVGTPALARRGSKSHSAMSGEDLDSMVSATLHLNAGDFVYLYCYTDDTNVDIDGGVGLTTMDITLIGT